MNNSCVHRLIHLSPLIREASICNKRWLAQRPTIGQSTKNKRLSECSALNSAYYTIASEGSGGREGVAERV